MFAYPSGAPGFNYSIRRIFVGFVFVHRVSLGKKLYFKETLEQPTGQSKMDNPETLKTLGTQKHTTKTKTKQNNNNNKTHNTN
jgi:hypothetical protein